MSLISIETLPDNSRIWIFAADRKLEHSETRELLETLDSYLSGWKAHGAPVQAARELKYDQFLIIAANPDVTAPSGCSIDHMTRAIRDLGAKFKVDFFGTMNVFFRGPQGIEQIDRPSFKQRVKENAVTPETIVFNNALTSLSELRANKWELPARDSWQAQLFKVGAAA